MYSRQSENNYPLALGISAVLMGVFLLLSFLYIIGRPFTDDDRLGMGGVVVNYGTSVEGMGDDFTNIDEPNQAPDANGQLPDKVTPTQEVAPTPQSKVSDQDIVTQDNQDAPAVNAKPTTARQAPNATVKNTSDKPAINQNALYKGPANKGLGRGDGEGTKVGNQGSINGDPLASNYGEGGSGFGNKPIELRRFTNLVLPKDDGQKTGRIAVRITINADGEVIDAVPGVKGTTLSDAELWEKCKKAVMGATLSKSASGQQQQTGTVVFNFKVR